MTTMAVTITTATVTITTTAITTTTTTTIIINPLKQLPSTYEHPMGPPTHLLHTKTDLTTNRQRALTFPSENHVDPSTLRRLESTLR